MLSINDYLIVTRHSTNIVTWSLVLTLLFSCDRKKPEHTVADQGTTSYKDSVDAQTTLPTIVSNHIQIVPTMGSVFSDSNTVHCSNIEYLWNSIVSNSDKDISGNILAKEFNKSRSWKNSMDTSSFVLAFGNPDNVYRSIVRQY